MHYIRIWTATWQNQQSDCAPSEDSDQPGHPPNLISLVRMKKPRALRYPLSGQRRLWSTQADLSLCWAHTHSVGFVMLWLIYRIQLPALLLRTSVCSDHFFHVRCIHMAHPSRFINRTWSEVGLDNRHFPAQETITVKIWNIQTCKTITVIIPKFEPCGFTTQFTSIQKMQKKWQTGAVWSGSTLFAQVCLS